LSFVSESESNLWCFYFSPRWSRPIGGRSGFNLSYSVQNFQNYDNEIVWGFTTQFLSPWASVWEGQNLTAAFKTYLIPRIILTAGAGYWDKRYLRTIEQNHTYYVQAKEAERRHDWQNKAYFGLQWPFRLSRGIRCESNLGLEYSDNRSNKILYRYSDFSVSLGMGIRF
jgi:hypothetical protein